MSVNVMTAAGNVGADMETTVTTNGKCIGKFPLAIETGFGDNKKTSWVTCKIFGDRAEKLAQYITKGVMVTATGEFCMEEWEKDGVKHSRPCMYVRDIQLPRRQDSQQQGWGQPQQPQQPQQQRPQQQMQQSNHGFDDDLPF
ncbi:MAG: single-stranded DNA-binding protein [Plesiomonas shigelloides]